MKQHSVYALVTGASQGLGRALAEHCAKKGLHLLLVALPGSGLEAVSLEFVQLYGVKVEYLEVDLCSPDSPENIVSIIRTKSLPVKLLINNAGIGSIGAFEGFTREEHESIINLNIIALLRLTMLLLPELRKQEDPGILNVASLGAFFPMPCFSVYSASKSFILHFSLALRNELQGSIAVSVLCPNVIRTSAELDKYLDGLGRGLRHVCLDPDYIADAALQGLARNQAVIVPGRINRILANMAALIPRPLSMSLIRRLWGQYKDVQLQKAVNETQQ